MLSTTITDIARATGTSIRRIGADWLLIEDSQFTWAVPVASIEQRADLILDAVDTEHAYDLLVAVPATIGTHADNQSWLTLPEDARREIVDGRKLSDSLCDIIERSLPESVEAREAEADINPPRRRSGGASTLQRRTTMSIELHYFPSTYNAGLRAEIRRVVREHEGTPEDLHRDIVAISGRIALCGLGQAKLQKVAREYADSIRPPLKAEDRGETWVIVDPDGGVWVPNQPAPTKQAAFQALNDSPLNGNWHS